MPTISKIRLTNVVYDDGNKRYNDELFIFDGHNSAIILENGGGKTVLIHTALQAIFPHVDLANRKIKNTLVVQNEPAHIAIEWINNDRPRRYVVTAVSLYATKQGIDSLRYVYEYGENDPNAIAEIPFVKQGVGGKRPADRGEMLDYYGHMRDTTLSAQTFSTIKDYRLYIEEQYQIIASEWDNIIKINSSEGGVEAFFEQCKTTNQLFDRLLIPTVEDSIEGHKENTFADMFEQQHESLKNYLNLKETIEENKQIQEKLNNYVSQYENLHQAEGKYHQTKAKVKGLWEATLEQDQESRNELEKLNNHIDQWQAEQKRHKVKQASYQIAIERQREQELIKLYDEARIQQAELTESHQAIETERLTLEVAKLKQKQVEVERELAQIKNELATLDQSIEAETINQQLVETKQALRGWYEQKQETLAKEKTAVQYQINPIQDKINKLTETYRDLSLEKDELNVAEGTQAGMINSRLKDMEYIKQEILANPKEEKVDQKLKQWNKRRQILDEEIIELNQLRKATLGDQEKQTQAKIALINEQQMIGNHYQQLSYQLEHLREAESQLITRLAQLRPQWASLDNVYSTQHSIAQRIKEKLVQLTKDQSRYFEEERLAYRFVDDYQDQMIFFADPFVEKKIESWKNEFDYLIMGIEYLQDLQPEDKQQLINYPFWSNTLITTKKEQQKVVNKLNSSRDHLQYPILVLTTEEALSITTEQYLDWITPNHWQHNLQTEKFIDWKQQLNDHAQQSRLRREEKAKEINQWETVAEKLVEFHDIYPYEDMIEKQEALSLAENQLESLKIKLSETERNLLAFSKKITEVEQVIEEKSAQKQGLESMIEKAITFLRYQTEVEQVKLEQREISKKIEQVTKELAKITEHQARFEAEKVNLRERIAGFTQQEISLKEEDNYQKVLSFPPKYTNEHRSAILSRLETLELKAREINRSRGEWEVRQATNEKELRSLIKQIEVILQDNHDLDQSKPFPSDGDQLIEKLLRESQKLSEQITQVTDQLSSRSIEKAKQEAIIDLKTSQFYEQFVDQEIEIFSDSLARIETQLKQRASKLLEQKQFLDQSWSRVKKELDAIEKATHLLENHIEKHHFNAPDIEAARLTPDQLRDYIYQRNQTVMQVTQALKDDLKIVEQENKQVVDEQHKFKLFCKNYISNIKLQQMAITGIETKSNYVDILNFKQNMTKSIERSSQYANEHIRASDKILQSFINQIHTHLINLTEELAQIPKKTRVKVNDNWKQIFDFKIPDWDRDVGLSRLRDYIEWILNKLNSTDYTLDNGLQDKGKIRNQIETWLESKQLLQIVMQNETMRVSCRKVTNDNQVSSRPHSWEQSNIWSGGEKWSKNMTLFLGILNYVAEKKGYQSGDAKKQRAVILDNPFGAASSDHVLNPVFFVAEQLGFQMIALTAHAEGKFLQDYFPVIFSCRLRQTTDVNKQVMETSKQLNYAYFEDHQPPEMERLKQTEQMELFE